MANQIGYDRYPQLTQSRGQIVPVPGTGDNGYRPNFTTPTPQETRWANQRGDALRRQAFTAPPDVNQSVPRGGMSPEAQQWQAERAPQPQGAAPSNSLRNPTPSLSNQAGRVAGQAYQGAKDYVLGERPEANTKLGKLKNNAAAASTALGRVAGAVQFGSALRDNFNNVYNVSASDDATLSDRAAAAVEGVGNTVVGGVTGLAKNFPIIGPAVAQLAGTNAVSDALDYISPGTSVINRFNRLRDEASAPATAQSPAAQAPSTTTPNTVAQNPAGVSATGQQGAAPAAPVMTGNVTRNGNEYSGTNIGGDITINGFAPGAGLGRGSTISPQNMAAADGLAAQQGRASLGRVMAAQQPLRQFAAPTTAHSGNDWTSREMLRRAKMDASSLIHRSPWAPKGSAQNAQAVYQDAVRADLKAQGMAPELQAETNRTNASIINTQASADASRYNSDNSLRGAMYSSDNTLRGNIYDADSRSVSAQAKLASDQKKAAAERRDKATERLDKVFGSYATGRDGKVDEGRLASLRNNAQAFIGSAAEAARKRGDTATAAALEEQGLAALADDPALMQRYASSMKADGLARGSWLNQYVGTDNPGGRVIADVKGGKVTFSDGTTAPRAKIEYMDNGILPHRFADWDPFADRTTEFDSMDPKGYLRKAQP